METEVVFRLLRSTSALSLCQLSCFLCRVSASPGREQRWTVGELLRWTTGRFESIALSTPRVDAEHLLAHALRCRRVDLYLQHDRLLGEQERAGFRDLVRRRLAREPVAYIEGVRGFHALDLDLGVDPRVLIPRPETEHLVDWVLETLPASPKGPFRLLDVGTGSGAIALAVKHARPDLEVSASDLSEGALEVAAANAARHGLDVDLRRSNLLEDLPTPDDGWNVIVANLPYVATAELDRLMPEVREFEPLAALDGGEDGLDLVRALLAQCVERRALSVDGHLFLEIGRGQADETQQAMIRAGFAQVERRKDLVGIERVVRGRWVGGGG